VIPRMATEWTFMAAVLTLLAEDLWLLAHHPDTGKRVVDSTRLSCGMAGAVLADLVLLHCVTLDERAVQPIGTTRTGDGYLDPYLVEISTTQKAHKPSWWITRFRAKRYQTLLVERAVRRGLVRHERSTHMFVMTVDRYHPTHPEYRLALIRHLRSVLTGTTPPEARYAALLGLVGAIQLDSQIFPDIAKRDRRRLIRHVLTHDQIGQAVRSAIQTIESATIATAIAVSATTAGDSAGTG
jgi:Golgi phosphoprotein 3 (GPP34)